jgi:hypothetical protein
MADKKVEPKVPEKTKTVAGARDMTETERLGLKKKGRAGLKKKGRAGLKKKGRAGMKKTGRGGGV